jgi:dienelactone hydrolase
MIHLARRAMLVFALLAAVGCGEDTPVTLDPPDLPLPTYYAIEDRVDGVLIGWSSVLTRYRESVWRGECYLPQHHPWLGWRETSLTPGLSLDWTQGPLAGPARAGRIALESSGWSALLAGWGELSLQRGLAPSVATPLLLDLHSPLAPAALGRAWDAAGRPASLALSLILLADPGATPQAESATLVFDGESEDAAATLDFHMDLAAGTAYLSLYREHFPAPAAVWWEGYGIRLLEWGAEPPDIDDQTFAPSFPAPAGYGAAELVLDAGGLALAATRCRPDGAGPFPAILLVADAGLADRNGAAVFGHLAHALAAAGYLVLRYDEPGRGESPGDPDALDLGLRRAALAAAWAALLADADVDPGRCALVGHGEGAALALAAAAGEPSVAAVAALSPLVFDPARVPAIPEAETGADWVELLGREVFAGKHAELLDFASEDYLTDAGWSGRPVFLLRAGADARLSGSDFAAQIAWLEGAGALVSADARDALGPFLTAGAPDDAPNAALVGDLIAWLAAPLGRETAP